MKGLDNNKLQYSIDIEAPKKSPSFSRKIHKYEHLTKKKILPYDQNRMTKEAKLCYSPLEQAFENKAKTTEVQRKIQIKALEVLEIAER